MTEPVKPERNAARPNNLRTALLVGALALFFFVLLFVKRLWLN
jgi:hypothetical protein